MNLLKKTAGFWLSQDIAVIPIEFLSKRPIVRWLEYTERLPTGDEINSWFENSMRNLGVITGWKNLVVIDFDEFAQYECWKAWCRNEGGEVLRGLETTRIVLTARGAHVYLHTEQKSENMKLPGIDILAQRKYVLAPPSVHPSGAKYQIFRDVLPARIRAIEDVLPAEWMKHQDCSESLKNGSKSAFSESGHFDTDLDPFEIAENPDAEYFGRNLISDIRSRFRIEDFFPDRISSDRGAGRWFLARCPLHDDRNPSLSIDVKNQVCSCRAGCNGGRSLDVINLFAQMNGLTNAEALSRLQHMIL